MSYKMEEKSNKENTLPPAVYTKLVENQAELTSYLKYIRHRPQPPRIPLSLPKHITTVKQSGKEKKASGQIKPYIQEYLRLVKEAANLQSYSGRKIISRLIQYLEEFPTMGFLVEVVNSFGRQKKKLCASETAILNQSSDEMVPLFQKVIQKVEGLKKEAESKKLMQLGQRIAHLQKMVEGARKQVVSQDSPLRALQEQRENIAKAEKNFGKFSQNFHKNQQIFSNINRVYQQIGRAHDLRS